MVYCSKKKFSIGINFCVAALILRLQSRSCHAFSSRPTNVPESSSKTAPRLDFRTTRRAVPLQLFASSSPGVLTYRAPKVADFDEISNLLTDCFETELKWFEFPERDARRNRYRDMLQKCFLKRIETKTSEDEIVSFMLMAESDQKRPVGFVQIGMLPPPSNFAQESADKEERTTDIGWSRKDVPYIANLCVLPDYRKAGIGRKMVDICIRWLNKKDKFDNVFISVDADNFAAKRFYEHIGFKWVEPPDMNPVRDYYYCPIQTR